MSIIDYDHLFDSADEAIARSIHDEECEVMRNKTLTLTWCAICGVSPQHHDIPGGRDHEWIDANAPKVSPWVKRNENYSQFSQPRGSQYEG